MSTAKITNKRIKVKTIDIKTNTKTTHTNQVPELTYQANHY